MKREKEWKHEWEVGAARLIVVGWVRAVLSVPCVLCMCMYMVLSSLYCVFIKC